MQKQKMIEGTRKIFLALEKKYNKASKRNTKKFKYVPGICKAIFSTENKKKATAVIPETVLNSLFSTEKEELEPVNFSHHCELKILFFFNRGIL